MGKSRNVVVKRDGKFYNKITGNYVTESTAKRLNSYFKRNPDKTLYQAYGKSIYKKEKKWVSQPKTIKDVYKKKTQVIKSKKKTGKPIYFSPILDKKVTIKEYDLIKTYDYKVGKFHIQLFRLTVDRGRIYHIITYPVNTVLETNHDIESLFSSLKYTFIKEASRLILRVNRNNPLSKVPVL